MSETHYNGPLDVVRRLNLEAEELDRLAQGEAADDPEIFASLKEQVANLEAEHPLLKQDVIIYGTPLNAGLDKIIRFKHPTAGPGYKYQSGKYGGMMLCETKDADTGEEAYRVVHTVHVGSSDMVPDGLGNLQQTHYLNYILAAGSEVVPTKPVNAHSLDDLKNDTVVAAVDRLVLNQENGRLKQLRVLGMFINKILSKEEWTETDISQQRVSYINSMGLLTGAAIATKELVLGDKNTYSEGTEVYFSDRSFLYNLTPDIFEVAPGYDRLENSDAPIMGGAPEIFISAHLDDGRPAFAPLKGISSVHTFS